MLLGNLLDYLSSVGRYLLKLVQKSKLEYVVSQHILQGSFLLPSDVCLLISFVWELFPFVAPSSWKVLGFRCATDLSEYNLSLE